MKYIPTDLPGVMILEPGSAGDGRGWFSQIYVKEGFSTNIMPVDFILENESYSRHGVVRGLHYQLPPSAQGKLVRVIEGCIVDVAVDIRQGSPTFGRHVAVELSDENRRQLWIPRGFAHGFSVTGDCARICYKCDNIYSPSHEAGIRYDDRALGIDWKIPAEAVTLSEKDIRQPRLADAKLFRYGEKLY
ncbi:MAG: dTDP-4-dehydrorhamnose 3,5-epimerase [Rikenellaceae bacterium]|nr:dTDP-4-dehydrorhamnose 3,5-epimerase [Rikenellaceae bacterium]